MKMKRFEGVTEQEAIEKVMAELGPGALVVNIKKTTPRGFFAFLRKPLVEVTAAYDETAADKPAEEKTVAKPTPAAPKQDEGASFGAAMKEIILSEQQQQIASLETQLQASAEMLRRMEDKLRVGAYSAPQARQYANSAVQAFHDTLLTNGVTESVAAALLDGLDTVHENDEFELNFIVKIVYNRIIEAIGAPAPISQAPTERGKPRVAAFIGSTGVGKTTTIAKLAAGLILDAGLNVGFVTADTYRIAAVEQLKTYADILGIEVGVAYTPEDVSEYIQLLGGINDVVMLDTAGRSPKNTAGMEELTQFLAAAGECEKYLVLSLTTRWEDMCEIVRAYDGFGDFKLIFTKLDEASCLGAVLNVCRETGRRASYLTCGQNVPDDIRPLEAAEVARALLGLGDRQNGSGQ